MGLVALNSSDTSALVRQASRHESLSEWVLMSCKSESGRAPHDIEGRYANHFQIGHNAFEFLLDFGQFYPEHESSGFHTRIITNPAYAKTLLLTLQGSIDRYEQVFGAIPEGDGREAPEDPVDSDEY
jgi:hypothetical protein